MRKTIEFVLPVVIKYETAKDLRDAIKTVKQNTKIEMISAGDTNFEYKSKRPKQLYYRGRTNQCVVYV
jgi:hypothetical protein